MSPYDFSTDAEPNRLYIKGGLIFHADGRITYHDGEPDDPGRLLAGTCQPDLLWSQVREWIDHHFPREVAS